MIDNYEDYRFLKISFPIIRWKFLKGFVGTTLFFDVSVDAFVFEA